MAILWDRLDDGSVKMFLTDPPFAQPDLYGRLAELAACEARPRGAIALPMRTLGDFWKCWTAYERASVLLVVLRSRHIDVPRYINDRHIQNNGRPIVAFRANACPTSS